MALTYGFFDSLNHDRTYNAEQFSSFLDGIVYDGVYEAVGNKFYVEAYSGMQLTVDTGRAWFDHTWILNTTKYVVTISTADTIYNRIDAVVLEINKNDRRGYIKVVKGSPTANPARPSLIKTSYIKQYALAYVTVPKLATSISQSNITYMVDTSETPLASALALSGIPSGGSIGQVLAKKSGESGSVDWYDFDKLPYDKWYLADGLNEGNVLAAYGFKNAANETAALRNINEYNSYPLLKPDGVTWSKSDGFYIPSNQFLNNESLYNLSPVSAIFKIDSIGSKTRTIGLHGHIVNGDTSTGIAVFLNQAYAVQSFSGRVLPYFGVWAETGYGQPKYGWNSSIETQAGVLGVTFNGLNLPAIYLNGIAIAMQRTTADQEITSSPPVRNIKLIGGNPEYYGVSASTTFRIKAAVFFNVAISADQHRQIANQMNSAFA